MKIDDGKKKLMLMATVLISAVATVNGGNLHIKVQISGLRDSVWIHPTDKSDEGVYCMADNGCLEIDYNVDSPKEVYLDNPCIFRGEKGAQVFFVAVPNDTLEITGSVDTGYILGGSHFYQGYNKVYQMFIGSRHRQNAIWRKYDSFWNRDKSESELKAMRDQELQAEREDKQQSLLRYIQEHANEEYAATAVACLDDTLMRQGQALLAEHVRNGRMSAYYLPVIERQEWRRESTALKPQAQAIGRKAPDFQLEDINGNLRKLSQFAGKYVVLDFWGSWCGVCIAGFPKMKEYYEKYTEKMVMLGIDCKDTKDRWKSAVKRLNIPWVQLYNGTIPPNDLMKEYAVSSFPTKIIISPEGTIEKVFIGEDPGFYKYLDSIINPTQ